MKLKDAGVFTLLVNMSGDVGYNAYKQTQLFRQQKFAFDDYPFVLKLTLHKTSMEVHMKDQSNGLPVRLELLF